LAVRSSAVFQRRNVQVVPRLGTPAEMQAEAIQQIRARVQYQKELIKSKGHGHEEEVNEMWRWVNISFWVGLPICALSLVYSFIFDEHHHRLEEHVPEFMGIRNKEFPWECGECDLFDLKCWKKCRAAKA
jgi:cytochrome c oxidase subunit 6a